MIKKFENYLLTLENNNDKEIIKDIKEIEKVIKTTDKDYYGKEYKVNKHCSGYLVKTNKREIKFLINDEQNCCETWGYFSSDDDFQDFIGSELIDVEVVDESLNTTKLKLEEIEKDTDSYNQTSTMFVNFKTSNGLLQFVAYNNHNGYYGHPAYFLIDDNIIDEKVL